MLNALSFRKIAGFAILTCAVFAIASFGGWASRRQAIVEIQQAVKSQVDELGGSFYYDYQLADPKSGKLLDMDDPDAPVHPLANLFGLDWFHDLFYVSFAQFDSFRNSGGVAAERSEIGDPELLNVLQLPGLRWLALSGTGVTDRGVKAISEVPQLEKVWLSQTSISDQGLVALGDCDSLTHLAIEGTQTTDAGLNFIARLPRLKVLSLGSRFITPQGLLQVVKIRSLEELFLDGSPVTDEVALQLAKLPQLETLSLRLTPLTNRGVSALAPLSRLRELHLDATGLSDAGMAVTSKWDELREFSFSRTAVSDEGLVHLRDCQQLQSIELAFTSCTLSGVVDALQRQDRPIDKCLEIAFTVDRNSSGKLISLDLSTVKIRDEDVSNLAKLHALEWLKMPNNRLSSQGVRQLCQLQLKQLTLLNIDGAAINQQDVRTLAEHLPALRNLSVIGVQLSSDFIEDMRSQFPTLRITYRQPENAAKPQP